MCSQHPATANMFPSIHPYVYPPSRATNEYLPCGYERATQEITTTSVEHCNRLSQTSTAYRHIDRLTHTYSPTDAKTRICICMVNLSPIMQLTNWRCGYTAARQPERKQRTRTAPSLPRYPFYVGSLDLPRGGGCDSAIFLSMPPSKSLVTYNIWRQRERAWRRKQYFFRCAALKVLVQVVHKNGWRILQRDDQTRLQPCVVSLHLCRCASQRRDLCVRRHALAHQRPRKSGLSGSFIDSKMVPPCAVRIY